MLRSSIAALLFTVAAQPFASPAAAAPQVWVGFGHLVAKPNFGDWTLPENHDSITPGVKLTRQDIQGMFNLAQESGYDGSENSPSPLDTEWAFGRAHDWEGLVFLTWTQWARSVGGPQQTVGLDAVLHLIGDDIYLDIRFLGFQGSNSGGGFSYIRATAETAVDAASASRLKALFQPEE